LQATAHAEGKSRHLNDTKPKESNSQEEFASMKLRKKSSPPKLSSLNLEQKKAFNVL
jgi:hypothetical protein